MLKGKLLREATQLQRKIKDRIDLTLDVEDINCLCRNATKLHTFFVSLCNDVEIDPLTDKAYKIGSNHSILVANPESDCYKRIQEVCNKYKLHYFIQRDPRGGTLYIWDDIISEGGSNEKGRFYSHCIFIT